MIAARWKCPARECEYTAPGSARFVAAAKKWHREVHRHDNELAVLGAKALCVAAVLNGAIV